jgi:hypothetical protein
MLALFLTAVAAVASAATPFDGKWIVHLTGPTTDTLHLTFNSNEDKIGDRPTQGR